MNLHENADNERLKYKKLMEDFKEISRDERKPFFILHQLGRIAKNPNISPQMEHLAEGADVERQAYDVWLVYNRVIRKEQDNLGERVTLVKIDKNKLYKTPIVFPVDYNVELGLYEDRVAYLSDEEYIELEIDKHELNHGEANGNIVLKNPKQKVTQASLSEIFGEDD